MGARGDASYASLKRRRPWPVWVAATLLSSGAGMWYGLPFALHPHPTTSGSDDPVDGLLVLGFLVFAAIALGALAPAGSPITAGLLALPLLLISGLGAVVGVARWEPGFLPFLLLTAPFFALGATAFGLCAFVGAGIRLAARWMGLGSTQQRKTSSRNVAPIVAPTAWSLGSRLSHAVA
jgi:hypothetical protein